MINTNFDVRKRQDGIYQVVLWIPNEFGLQLEYEVLRDGLSKTIAETIVKKLRSALKDNKDES